MNGGHNACPPYIPFVPPNLGEAPWAKRDPVHGRAAEAERARQRPSPKSSLLKTGQLALAYLRYIIAGEIAGARAKFGWLRAMLTNLARLLGLSVMRNMGAASRFEGAPSTAWAHLERGRRNLRLIWEELAKVDRDRLLRCVNDQITEFADRKKTKGSFGACPSYSRNLPRKRAECRQHPSNSQRAARRRTYNRGRSPYGDKYQRSPKKEAEGEKSNPGN